jgi:hypothetical protein
MGGGFGMGGEDGRADGGAVRLSAVTRWSVRCDWAGVFLVFLFVGIVSFSTSCAREKAQPASDAVTQLQAIAPADPAQLASLQGNKHWSNPYLVVRPEGVGLLTGVAANEEQILKPEEVLRALAQLPASAWPYGRAVAILVDAKPTSSEQDKIALRRNRGIVAGELESAHVVINWIPSS